MVERAPVILVKKTTSETVRPHVGNLNVPVEDPSAFDGTYRKPDKEFAPGTRPAQMRPLRATRRAF